MTRTWLRFRILKKRFSGMANVGVGGIDRIEIMNDFFHSHTLCAHLRSVYPAVSALAPSQVLVNFRGETLSLKSQN